MTMPCGFAELTVAETREAWGRVHKTDGGRPGRAGAWVRDSHNWRWPPGPGGGSEAAGPVRLPVLQDLPAEVLVRQHRLDGPKRRRRSPPQTRVRKPARPPLISPVLFWTPVTVSASLRVRCRPYSLA